MIRLPICSVLILLGLGACTTANSPSTAEPTPAPATTTVNETSAPASDETPKSQVAFSMTVAGAANDGDLTAPDSRFDTMGSIYLYGPNNTSLIFTTPTEYEAGVKASFEAKALNAHVSRDGVESLNLVGTMHFDELDGASGRIAMSFNGTTESGEAVSLVVDGTVTPLGQ